MTDTSPASPGKGGAFDPSMFHGLISSVGHGGHLGMRYRAHGDSWVELELPYAETLIGDVETGVIASGPIISLMDMASGMAIWQTRGTFQPVATLDLRVDYQRPARERASVKGRVECYRLTRSAAFVRGIAYDDDPSDPVAHVAGCFMTIGADPRDDRLLGGAAEPLEHPHDVAPVDVVAGRIVKDRAQHLDMVTAHRGPPGASRGSEPPYDPRGGRSPICHRRGRHDPR